MKQNFTCELHQILQKITNSLFGHFFLSQSLGRQNIAILTEARKSATNSAYQNGPFKREGGKKAHLLAIRLEAHLVLVPTERITYSIVCIHKPTSREILNH